MNSQRCVEGIISQDFVVNWIWREGKVRCRECQPGFLAWDIGWMAVAFSEFGALAGSMSLRETPPKEGDLLSLGHVHLQEPVKSPRRVPDHLL